jgi:hypothetical protein
MRHCLSSAVAVAALIGNTQAWSYGGHVIVTYIAQTILEKEDPSKLAIASEIAALVHQNYPYKTPTEDMYPFIECAAWADASKYNGGGFQSAWHFNDQPYLDEGPLSDYTFKKPAMDVTGAINGIVNWINKKGDYKSDYYYQKITQTTYLENHTAQDTYSMGLRFLLHYVGDQHQPLHSTTRVDSTYDNGDRGGNSFLLPSHYSCKNLHCVWDRVVYEWKTNPHLPFTNDGFTAFKASVATLMARWPVSKLYDVTDLNPATW